ncbi:hypothetical protein BC826DRAFT_342954 [Russula brevipes]|nr:hypothetical protein BC826DRAFT_342954 [Russula brevipes]
MSLRHPSSVRSLSSFSGNGFILDTSTHSATLFQSHSHFDEFYTPHSLGFLVFIASARIAYFFIHLYSSCTRSRSLFILRCRIFNSQCINSCKKIGLDVPSLRVNQKLGFFGIKIVLSARHTRVVSGCVRTADTRRKWTRSANDATLKHFRVPYCPDTTNPQMRRQSLVIVLHKPCTRHTPISSVDVVTISLYFLPCYFLATGCPRRESSRHVEWAEGRTKLFGCAIALCGIRARAFTALMANTCFCNFNVQ